MYFEQNKEIIKKIEKIIKLTFQLKILFKIDNPIESKIKNKNTNKFPGSIKYEYIISGIIIGRIFIFEFVHKNKEVK